MLKNSKLYEELKDQEVSKTQESIDDIMKNLIFEIHSHSTSSTNIPINSDSLIEQQKSDKFCKNKVKQLHCQKQPDFELDDKGIFRKLVHLHHNWTSTAVVPKSLINNIIYEYHNAENTRE